MGSGVTPHLSLWSALSTQWPGLRAGAAVGLLSLGCSGEPGGPSIASAGGAGAPSASGASAIGGAGGASTTPGFGGTQSAGASGGSVSPNPISMPPSSQVCPSTGVARTPLRRLTRFEYANTVKHLLNVSTDFTRDIPVDEVTDGFSNNAGVLTVSPLHAEKYVLAAEAAAKEAVANLASLAPCDATAKGEETCAREFARSFGRRAFRRPTTPEDEQLLMGAYNVGRTGGSYAEGLEVLIRAALQSPHFLYRLELAAPADTTTALVPVSPFEIATRLSYLVWASGPDDALLDAAASGELSTKEQVAARARTMLADPKARAAVADFYAQWLGTNRLEVTNKNTALFPAYTPAVREAMGRELPAFVEDVLWAGDRKLDTLLTSPVSFVTGPLAELYGLQGSVGDGPQRVTLPAAQGRSGILTQAAFLSVQAHPDQTSPVLRGKFVRTKLLCQPPPPPPPDADISPPEIDQGGTARERFSAHLTAGNTCNGCHVLMDPIGLVFEHFDAVGSYRATDAGRPIDASGEIAGATEPVLIGTFTGVRELGKKLAASDQVRDCVATQWFRFASGRSEEPADACSLATMQEAFASSEGDLVTLIVSTTQTDAFWHKRPVTP